MLGLPMTEEGPVPIDEAAEIQEAMRSLKPTLDIDGSKDGGSDKGSKDRLKNDSKFSTTFGFSHGVDVNAPGHASLKKSLAQRMMSTRNANDLLKDKKQMQICFSIASKASTMTQHITDSY